MGCEIELCHGSGLNAGCRVILIESQVGEKQFLLVSRATDRMPWVQLFLLFLLVFRGQYRNTNPPQKSLA